MAGNKASEIPKAYEANNVEDSIYKMWEESGFFNPDNLPGKREESFTISMPPPNVTGILHLGHALENSLMDIQIRYQRMQGKKALLLPGTDHAAVATQARVEDNLKKEGMKNPRQELGREKLLEKIREYAENSKSTILNQIRKMGTSCDWSRLAYTFDDQRSVAVNELFVRMYNDGLIYRGYRVVHWSVVGQSTCSDDELVYVDKETMLYTFKYSKDFPIPISTTRPETKLGDAAVAVNPDDERYKQYIGEEFTVDVGAKKPLKIKIIADKNVDPKYGTGALGVTPAHSQVDFEMYQANKEIGLIQVIGLDGKMTQNAGVNYEGLEAIQARGKFVEWLKSNDLIIAEEKMSHSVGTSDRFGDVVEAIPMDQWFIDVNKEIKGRGKSLKELMREAVTTGHGGDRNKKVSITPEGFNKMYLQRVEDLHDWNISRQIWWGHRIPVWYKVGKSQIANRKSKFKVMGFHEKVVPQVFAGKTKTYRLRPKDVKVGEKVAFENSQAGEIFGSGKIIDITETTVGEIPLGDKAHGETYNKIEELINAFKRHYSEMEITSDTTAYIYTYDFKPGQMSEEIYVGLDEPKEDGWEQDPDTLDTWFSSGAWTFSTLGWPDKTDDLKTFHPTAWMQMGYEIVYLWLMRMILMSTYALDEIPFHEVYIHGMLRDKEGNKFSKSSGNGLDPLEMINKYGTDALRLSLIKGSTPGTDANFYEEKIEGARNFVNKLWNVSRYILMNISEVKLVEKQPKPKTLADAWILSKLNELVVGATDNLEKSNFSVVAEHIYEFTGNELADWYIEISKIKSQISKMEQAHTDQMLLYILQTLLKLWHPFTPFVTEEIWKKLGAKDMLMIQSWPSTKGKIAKTEVKNFEFIQELIVGIRNLRMQAKIPPAKLLKIVIASPKHTELINQEGEVIKKLARLDKIDVSKDNKKPTESLSSVVSIGQIYLPVSGMMDIGKEIKRLEDESKRIEDFVKHLAEKLTNERFLERAPADIIENEKIKLTDHKEKLEQIKQQLKTLK